MLLPRCLQAADQLFMLPLKRHREEWTLPRGSLKTTCNICKVRGFHQLFPFYTAYRERKPNEHHGANKRSACIHLDCMGFVLYPNSPPFSLGPILFGLSHATTTPITSMSKTKTKAKQHGLLFVANSAVSAVVCANSKNGFLCGLGWSLGM